SRPWCARGDHGCMSASMRSTPSSVTAIWRRSSARGSPKVESPARLATADWLLAQLERDQGLVPRAIDLVPIIETARGLSQIDAILAAGTRVKRVAFGAGDFTLDVNMAWSRNEAELAYARAKIVTASRA